MSDRKIYCIHCGCAHSEEKTVCEKCGKSLIPKETILQDYLISHTKDKVKGDIEDSIYDTIFNYLKCHLYGMFITIEVAAVAVTAITANAEKRPAEGDRPQAVSDVTVVTQQQLDTYRVTIPEYDFETQAAILAEYYDLWRMPSDFSMYASYQLTDMDLNGRLEITSSSTMGTGIFTESVMYEVNETMDGVTEILVNDMDVPDSFTTIAENRSERTEHIGYYDPINGTVMYIGTDTWRAGWASHGTNWMLVTKDANYRNVQIIGYSLYNVDNAGNETERYYVGDEEAGSEAQMLEGMRAQLDPYCTFTFGNTTVSSDGNPSAMEILNTLIDGWSLQETFTPQY
ncbi:MAG: hypothetical protein ACI32N_05730 [Bulleidia sp.]